MWCTGASCQVACELFRASPNQIGARRGTTSRRRDSSTHNVVAAKCGPGGLAFAVVMCVWGGGSKVGIGERST